MTYTDPAEIAPRPETPTWWPEPDGRDYPEHRSPAWAQRIYDSPGWKASARPWFQREELALPQGTVTEPHSLITSDRS